MDYIELVKSQASSTDIQAFLTGGEATAVTVRIPKNLRDSIKTVAGYKGTNFSAFIRECLIEKLSEIKR